MIDFAFESVASDRLPSKRGDDDEEDPRYGFGKGPPQRGLQPYLFINRNYLKGKISKQDVFDPEIFGMPLSCVLERQANNFGLCIGCFHITLTLDSDKTCFLDAEGKFVSDRIFNAIKAKLERQGYPCPISIVVADVGEKNGRLHFHLVLYCVTAGDVIVTKGLVKWWETNHGTVDIAYIRNLEHLAAVWQYCTTHEDWHDNVPESANLAPAKTYRHLEMTNFARLKKIKAITLAFEADSIAGDKKPRKPVVPLGVAYGVEGNEIFAWLGNAPSPEAAARNLWELNDPEVVNDILSLQNRGYLAAYGRLLHHAVMALPDDFSRRVLIEKMTSRNQINRFMKSVFKGGLRKPLRDLRNLLIRRTTDPKDVWKVIQIAKEYGLRTVVCIHTDSGVRRETNLDLCGVFGLHVLTPEELAAKRLDRKENPRRCG